MSPVRAICCFEGFLKSPVWNRPPSPLTFNHFIRPHSQKWLNLTFTCRHASTDFSATIKWFLLPTPAPSVQLKMTLIQILLGLRASMKGFYLSSQNLYLAALMEGQAWDNTPPLSLPLDSDGIDVSFIASFSFSAAILPYKVRVCCRYVLGQQPLTHFWMEC